MFDFMLRLDYYMPEKNCSLCTVYFMTEAYEGKLYVPRQAELCQANRFSCSTTKEIKEELLNVIEANLTDHPLSDKLFELRRHL